MAGPAAENRRCCSCLPRAWDPSQGEILLNNQPLSGLSEATLRQAMSVVPQRVHLFQRHPARQPAAGGALKRMTLISALPLRRWASKKLLQDGGLNGWLGEGGRQLSGGELRRLAIARALLHDAPLMLLDEPTEGLDAATESQILHLLADVMRDKTVLMVTHRLRGLAGFNQIIVMDNGQIIEQGSHAELLAKQGRYFQFKQRL
ncbi:transport ATP-binding protein CydC [Klebsiella pneumoniae]|uniref:Transport ATP-binding protein CydC n=1 Tax=Klebsiella pneumoniae TaxID=573 RepID=A0A4P0Y0N0_KLEPN|nr:transport ATP-binding protein CydC [Klebsiella pneumoniae]